MNDTAPPPMPAASAPPPPMPAASAPPPPMPAASAAPPPMPPSFPPAVAGLPNKFCKLLFAGCAAVVALIVIVIASCALSRSPAEQCVDTANDARTAILEGRAGDLYEMLPPSWQKDLDGQLQLLATKFDESAFQQLTGLAGDLAVLGEEKEDVILDWIRAEHGDDVFNDKDALRDLIGALRVVSKWKYADVRNGRFRSLFGDRRVAALLSRIIRRAMVENEASVSEFSLVDPKQKDVVTLRVTTSERSYDTYEFRYKTVTEEQTLDWVRFEGCWVPKDLLNPKYRDEGWQGAMENLRRDIQRISPKEVAQFAGAFSMIRVMLPQFRAAQSGRDLRRMLRDLDLD